MISEKKTTFSNNDIHVDKILFVFIMQVWSIHIQQQFNTLRGDRDTSERRYSIRT